MFTCKTSKLSYVLSQVSYLHTDLLSYPHLLLPLVSPWLFSQLFSQIPSVSRLNLYFALVFYSIPPCISPSPAFLGFGFCSQLCLQSVVMLQAPPQECQVWCWHTICSFISLGHDTFPHFPRFPVWRAAGLLLSLPGSSGSENKTLTCEGSDLPALHLQPRLHLLKSSALSLLLSPTPRQTSCQQTLISLGTRGICSYGKHFFRVL